MIILEIIGGAMLIGTIYFVAVCLVQIGHDIHHWWRNR